MSDLPQPKSTSTPLRIAVAMIGARRHYAVPRLLYAAGLLEHFYTDICAIQGWPRLFKLLPKDRCPKAIRRLIDRVPLGIPTHDITSFPGFGFLYFYKLARARSLREQLLIYEWAGKQFNRLIDRQGLGDANTVYTFNGAGLELMDAAKACGLITVMEQTIAPFRNEVQLLREEQTQHSDWEALEVVSDEIAYHVSSREEAEWNKADLILCGSEYVKGGIIECGGPGKRCVVVPYGVDSRLSWIQREPHEGPLRVLTVGSIGLRKGAPYLLEAAKRLEGHVVFRMVGPVGVLPSAEAKLQEHVELIGQVPRSEISRHYQWADVFLLPSLNEGSAAVVYEALSCGLPVICTPNTGSVVRDGIDGFIVPIRDPEAIYAKLEQLVKDRELCLYLSRNARQRAAEFTMAEYERRLVNALNLIPTPILQ